MPVTLTFNAVINSGSLTFTHFYNGSSYALLSSPHTVTSGLNTITIPALVTGTTRYLSSDTVTDANIDITDITILTDTMTITRAQYGTTVDEHSADATVQLCEILNDNVVDIIYRILTVYGDIPTTYIPYDNGATGR